MLKIPSLQRARRRGISLIIVLASIVLLTVLVLAFLASVGSELQTSKVYANGSSVKLLVQSTVSLVIGQIQTATSDQTLCWASQPGMIRTYDNTGTAAGEKNYKLYSDANLTTTGAFSATSTLVPTNWYSQKGVYVDLNQPVSVGSTAFYPILDGNSADYTTAYATPLLSYLPGGPPSVQALKYSTSANLSPSNNLPGVTGFWINSNAPIDPTSPNVAPMPVMWLYVLQDGSVLIPDSTSTGTVTFTNAATNGGQTPTTANPIVGRMAYWTDDETCKVNVNTASAGNTTSTGVAATTYGVNSATSAVNSGTASNFWDTPRVISSQDYAYAMFQPAQHEYQRYPGHPAMVDLSAVFNGLTADPNFPEDFYPLTPRIISGGSKSGTVSVLNLTSNGTLTLRGTRLYATPDEFLFQPSLISGVPGSGLRNLNDAAVSSTTMLDPTAVEKAKFFITAVSEAPDVNVFNLPRVSMWPITLNSAGTPAMTAYDQLIAFCGTINNNIYYFQRQDPSSSTTDLPTSSFPTGLKRNRALMEYLRTLTSQSIPGFGGSFSGKYPNGDRDQILTEMFDYIRSTNIQDTSAGATTYAQIYGTATTTGSLPYYQGGLGQVVPIIDQGAPKISDTVTAVNAGTTQNYPRGFGRFPTVQEASLVFIGAGDNATDPSPDVTGTTTIYNTNPPYSYTPQVGAGKQRVQCGFFLQMYDPSEGVPVTRPWYQIQVSGLNNLQWGGVSIFPTGIGFPYCYNTNGISIQPIAASINANSFILPTGTANGYSGYSYGGLIDFRQQSLLRDSITGGSATANGNWGIPVYPYISPPTGQAGTGPDLPTNGTFDFSAAGDVTVKIFALNAAGVPSALPVQTVYLNFPSTKFPVPYSIDNNRIMKAPLYNIPPYTTPSYYNIPQLTPASILPYSAATYLPFKTTTSGTTTTYSAADPTNYNFLGFLDSYGSATHTLGSGIGRLGFPAYMPWITTCDVVRSVVATPGDIRLIATRQFVPDSFYKPIIGSGLPGSADYYYNSAYNPPLVASALANPTASQAFSHMLRILTGQTMYGALGGKLIVGAAAYDDYQTQNFTVSTGNYSSTMSFSGSSGQRAKDPDIPNQTTSITVAPNGVYSASNPPGDWDTGFANTRDGAFINKPDEGDAGTIASGSPPAYASNGNPYYELDYATALPGPTFFSPNRMIPSPGMFGSLPSQVWANTSWQTLLFRPGPAKHYGLGTASSIPSSGPVTPPYSVPPDHLFMDLFNMPVVEPYAISSPLATAGRVNMNYQIVPFTYINRDTALRAAMKNQTVMAIPSASANRYKTHQNVAAGFSGNALNGLTAPARFTINMDSTLSQFLQRFYSTSGTPDIFHSASEICTIDLIPNDPTAATLTKLALPITRANMDAYWVTNSLTGDNLRERPYTNLYPLLTTKSNTFTVHYRVQTLKQVTGANANPAVWREGTDVVVGESRGSQTIERYVDPNNAKNANKVAMPDYAGSIAAGTFPPSLPLSQFYKFRVVSSRQFAP